MPAADGIPANKVQLGAKTQFVLDTVPSQSLSYRQNQEALNRRMGLPTQVLFASLSLILLFLYTFTSIRIYSCALDSTFDASKREAAPDSIKKPLKKEIITLAILWGISVSLLTYIVFAFHEKQIKNTMDNVIILCILIMSSAMLIFPIQCHIVKNMIKRFDCETKFHGVLRTGLVAYVFFILSGIVILVSISLLPANYSIQTVILYSLFSILNVIAIFQMKNHYSSYGEMVVLEAKRTALSPFASGIGLKMNFRFELGAIIYFNYILVFMIWSFYLTSILTMTLPFGCMCGGCLHH